MKKTVLVLLLAAAMCMPVQADIVPTEPVLEALPQLGGSNYGKGVVTYDDKITTGTSNFYAMNSVDWFKNTTFDWVSGYSGEEGDFAPHVQYNTNSIVNFSQSYDMLYLFYCENFLKNINATLLLDFDVKADTNTDSLILYFPRARLWHSGTGPREGWEVLAPNGKVPGTDYCYKVGEWMRFHMTYELPSGTWNVTVTDSEGEHKIVDGVKGTYRDVGWEPDAATTRIVFVVWQQSQKNPDESLAGFALDNVCIRKGSIPASGNIFSPKEDFEADDITDVPISATVTDADNVIFEIDGTEVARFDAPGQGAYTYSESVDLFKFEPGERKLTVKKTVGDETTTLSERNFTLTRKMTGDIKINSVLHDEFVAGHATATTVSVKERGEEPQTATVFACMYDADGGLVSCDSGRYTGENVDLMLNVPAEYDPTTWTARVYLLESPLEIADFIKI